MYLNINKKILVVFLSAIFFLSIFAFLFKYKEIIVIYNDNQVVMSTRIIFANDVINEVIKKDVVFESEVLSDLNLFGNTIIINTEKNINVTVKDETFMFTTYENTVDELINELDMLNKEFNYIAIDYDNNSKLEEITDIKIVKYEVVLKEEINEFALNEVHEYDNTKTKGSRTVISYGTPKIIKSNYSLTYHDDEIVNKELLEEQVIDEGTSTVVSIGTKTIDPVYYDGDTVWDSLAKCESGGNWSTNTGNGYYGGLQFSYRTWKSVASKIGLDIEYAHMATREQQIQAATYLQQQSGWGQWPGCSRKLGLL